ncbi:histone-lysine N-methyltransferase SETMAR [Trichonephila clavata]|uniref:Histone-lysine N-methyltransferase SETMAR n=1 Tax=Trichonephila clavata TaxID=2740835 RepID=A0A8X6FW12_TRICU|nr:histone-lysine N-methyltransferase SETMAR [Trichonephila clavata]
MYKQSTLIYRKVPILLYGNSRPHVSMITHQKFHAFDYKTLNNPPYSPHLSPMNYHFSKHLDHLQQKKYFSNPRDAKTAFNELVSYNTAKFYDTGRKKLVFRWHKCVEANGSCFD